MAKKLISLLGPPNKAKNHWKNVRDRFVKVMHAREKHFANNGSEIDAPNYVYYKDLEFMREFSIKKQFDCNEFNYTIAADDLVPEFLISNEVEGNVDYTSHFLEAIQKFPSLYDSSAELRKYQGINEWKAIALQLDSKFSTLKLRDYWKELMKKYKLWYANRDLFDHSISNEEIFEEMTFVKVDTTEEFIRDDMSITFEFEEESLEQFDETAHDDISTDGYEDFSELEPPEKRARIKIQTVQKEAPDMMTPKDTESKSESSLDEFDYFAKKVALQLKQIATKDRKSARKAEIEILKLLMDYEDNS